MLRWNDSGGPSMTGAYTCASSATLRPHTSPRGSALHWSCSSLGSLHGSSQAGAPPTLLGKNCGSSASGTSGSSTYPRRQKSSSSSSPSESSSSSSSPSKTTFPNSSISPSTSTIAAPAPSFINESVFGLSSSITCSSPPPSAIFAFSPCRCSMARHSASALPKTASAQLRHCFGTSAQLRHCFGTSAQLRHCFGTASAQAASAQLR
eukprot:CAMPEP_0172044268 /NCGR_PEP_ID=MMETSP1041-20130122/26706_1 /TAXON_ID=464988 /ORGANISM="Hemiselmis andersenii, Strain CCMP439" /LENGTH=206 /DNA_ID=CAMNT_0012702751 /DNA_START=80 /DNA_END=696 /DNA_ORIENTATION=+